MKEQKNFLIPMAFIGLMFFTCGFALGINSLLVPVLKVSLQVTSMKAYMLIGATFLPFLIFGYPAGMLISKIGYKHTMASAFAMFSLAFVVFILSAKEESFLLFLVASFACGTANTFLQSAINPYVTILGPTESAAQRISIMGMINKLAWPVSPLFIAFVVGNSDHIAVADLAKPFAVIIGRCQKLRRLVRATKKRMLKAKRWQLMPTANILSFNFHIWFLVPWQSSFMLV